MTKVLHLIGNGDNATMYKQGSKGVKITCNLPPFPVEGAYTTCLVDFKMMAAIHEGSVDVPGPWVLGYRPKKWMEMKPQFYMKHAQKVRQFYLTLPKYVNNYTDFNCGHFAAHYSATTFKPDEEDEEEQAEYEKEEANIWRRTRSRRRSRRRRSRSKSRSRIQIRHT